MSGYLFTVTHNLHCFKGAVLYLVFLMPSPLLLIYEHNSDLWQSAHTGKINSSFKLSRVYTMQANLFFYFFYFFYYTALYIYLFEWTSAAFGAVHIGP